MACPTWSMNKSFGILYSQTTILLMWSTVLVFAHRHCPTGKYFELEKQGCKDCSLCPRDQIIRKPCSNYSDTTCGPFKEFDQFNQPGFEGEFTNPKLFNKNEDIVTSEDHVVEIEGIPTITKDEGEYWKNLAFALIGVLCALIIVATIVVLCACRKLQETAGVKRPEEDDDDADSGYVVIRAIRQLATAVEQPPATAVTNNETSNSNAQIRRQQRLQRGYRPKRRLLNEYVDDVFESEDSAGSRRSCKLPLHAIPEHSDSESRHDESEDA